MGGDIIEINTIDAIRNSADKRKMKNCFMKAKVATADWFVRDEIGQFHSIIGIGEDKKQLSQKDLPFPIVAKHVMGSRGTGNYKLENLKELEDFLQKKDTTNFIFEKYYAYVREYRLHMTSDGCFYTCRKMLRNDAPKETSWQRHDDNCVWYIETNPKFDKPVNWDEVVEHCKRALESVGLDVGSFDVRIQSASDPKSGKVREKCEFIIIECNSASSLGDNKESIVFQKYLETLPKLIMKKAADYALLKGK